ncbi:MAG: peptidylprolyl isomerase [Rhodocyclaceae bacterium]
MNAFIRALLALLLAATLAPRLAQAQQAIDRIAAVVNDDIITLSDLRTHVATARATLSRQGTPLPPANQLERQVLDRMVYDKLQVQEARNTNIQVDDSVLGRALQTIADNNKLTLEQLRQAVEKQENIPWDRFREDIRTEILLTRLREREIDSKVVVTDAEIDAFLSSPEAAAGAREVMIQHILLRAPEAATPEQWNNLRKRADEVQRLVHQGDDFAKLAAAFSDAQDAMQGGALDWRPMERLPVLYATALARMSPGQVSDTLQSSAGLHIIKFVDARAAEVKKQQIEQTHARHILIRSSEASNDADVRLRLLGLRERIVNGVDFAELARTNSGDGTAAKGGDLGWLSPGETVPEFERAMNALKIGELSQPIQSPFGWHLIQVLERRTVDVTDDRRRTQAREAIHDRKADEAFEDWLRQLRDQAYVDIRLDENR